MTDIVPTVSLPKVIGGLREILDSYDLFLVDQYGVVHDGITPFPGAIAVLQELCARNKKIVILSNSSARVHVAAQKYAEMGLPSVYTGFLTSGEVTWNYLNAHYRGKKCIWFGWRFFPTDNYLKLLDITPTSDPNEADFVFFQGSQCLVTSHIDADHHSSIDMQFTNTGIIDETVLPLLLTAAKRGLPSICANMDVTVVNDNKTFYMAGFLHNYYKQLTSGAANVIGFGKPDPAFFRQGMELGAAATLPLDSAAAAPTNTTADTISRWISHRRVVHLGDSLHHDIAGAVATNIDSVFITHHGVHREAFVDYVETTTCTDSQQKRLLEITMSLCEQEKCPSPTYILTSCQL